MNFELGFGVQKFPNVILFDLKTLVFVQTISCGLKSKICMYWLLDWVDLLFWAITILHCWGYETLFEQKLICLYQMLKSSWDHADSHKIEINHNFLKYTLSWMTLWTKITFSKNFTCWQSPRLILSNEIATLVCQSPKKIGRLIVIFDVCRTNEIQVF